MGKNDNEMKWCPYHKEYHPRSEFGVNNTNKDGLHQWCRAAVSEYFKERYKDPEVKEKRKRYALDYYYKNRDAQLQKGRERRQRYKKANTGN